MDNPIKELRPNFIRLDTWRLVDHIDAPAPWASRFHSESALGDLDDLLPPLWGSQPLSRTSATKGTVLAIPTIARVMPRVLRVLGWKRSANNRPIPIPNIARVPAIRPTS